MKNKEEIRREAEEMFWKRNGRDFEEHEITQIEKGEYIGGYLGGYTQCQEDMVHKMNDVMETLLKIRDCKDYGNNSSSLARELIQSLNKQD